MRFRQCQQGVHHNPVHQAEIADIFRQFGLGDLVMDFVKPAGSGAFGPAVGIAVDATPQHHFKAVLPELQHFQNNFGRVLQVNINRHYHLTLCYVEAGGHGRFLAEIATQVHHSDACILLLTGEQRAECLIGAAVIDKDKVDFDGRMRCKHFRHFLQKTCNRFRFIENRYCESQRYW